MWRHAVARTLLLGISLAGLYTCADATCSRDPPETSAAKTPGDNGFRIKIAGRPESYTPGQVYTVSIEGTYSNQKFVGFMLVAVPQFASDETTAIGTFQHMNHGLTKFSAACPHMLTHTYLHPKSSVDVMWTAPPAGTGCVELRATVVEFNDIWYKNDGALTRLFCENTGVMENDKRPEMVADCCACGVGKYQLTFKGIWSRQSHPKHFPIHKRLLHWSNIVGASHTKSYTVWQYGGYASKGIKETCEYGYPRSLELEMRKETESVRTVIKTPGIWWADPEGLRQSRWARFSVDRKRHLISMVSMFGPSPDWCVGVSGLNLCLPNCTWAGDMEIDMLPWDAGTDDGVTFMSRNKKSEPQQKIHHITNTFPSGAQSPFYGASPIKPLALLKIRRIYPKTSVALPCDGSQDPAAVDTSAGFVSGAGGGKAVGGRGKAAAAAGGGDLTDAEKEQLLLGPKDRPNCVPTEWSEWSSCSVTCDVGQQTRSRQYSALTVDETMCNLKLTESQSCRGREQYCEKPQDACSVTQWSEWSPCSKTCGPAGREERRRVYLKRSDTLSCHRILAETQACSAAETNCAAARSRNDFTAICILSKDLGPCRGNFPRWYYNAVSKRCVQFSYGGCRGNDNKFLTQAECAKVCETKPPSESNTAKRSKDKRKGAARWRKNQRKRKNKDSNKGGVSNGKRSPVNKANRRRRCLVSAWSEWSACSASCGKSYRFKRRTITQQPTNGGHKCPRKLERKRRCRLQKCPRACRLGRWGEWTACAHTCGTDSMQERTRRVAQKARLGGKACGPTSARRQCRLPACPKLKPWKWDPLKFKSIHDGKKLFF